MAMHHALGVGTRFLTNLRLPENAWKCIMHSGWASHICDISKLYDFLRMHGNASCIRGTPPIFVTSLRLPENAWKCIMHSGYPSNIVTSWGWPSHICDISIFRLPQNAWKCIMHWGWASHIVCDTAKNSHLGQNS